MPRYHLEKVRTSRDEIVGIQNNRIKIRISAHPQEGKANNQLIKFLAKNFGVAKSQFLLLSGESGREKRIRITSPDKDKAARLLSKL
ncbi:MAG: YggU family protein [Gammaproteobacteria bacterium]|nr:YggU family protein [Gammaproteobacteria bacterium]